MVSESAGTLTVCKYGVRDEGTHGGEGVPDYNESAYFNFFDPVAKIGGILRTGNRPTQGRREFSVNLKLPGGSLAFRAGHEPSTENLRFSCSGLQFDCEEPTRRWTLKFRGSLTIVAQPTRLAHEPGRLLKSSPTQECEIELEWRAVSPMFVLTADGSGRATPGETSLMGTDHYEQFGGVTGRIRLGKQVWLLADAPSMRDHTWGPRVWGTFNGEWLCGFLPDGSAMTLYSELQPTGKRAYSGALMFDGKPHYVSSFDVFTAYDGGAVPEDRFRAVLKVQGLPAMPLDGTISHFSPLSMGTPQHRTRLTSMVVEFVNGAGGIAFAEFLRPLPPK